MKVTTGRPVTARARMPRSPVMRAHLFRGLVVAATLLAVCVPLSSPLPAEEPAKLPVLFLGDRGHHRPADMAKIISAALAKVQIDVTYTEDVGSLAPDNLARYDAVAIFCNTTELPKKNE